jgi:hypothetical protein
MSSKPDDLEAVRSVADTLQPFANDDRETSSSFARVQAPGPRGLQRVVCCRRRCSLAFVTSLMSAAGRISKMLPYFKAGCCAMSCTA